MGRKRKFTHHPEHFLQDWQLAEEQWEYTLRQGMSAIQVSTCGRVRVNNGPDGYNTFKLKGQILDSGGRPLVRISGKYHLVSRLVAETYVAKRLLTRRDVVDHIDGNMKRNWHWNLKVFDKSTHSAIKLKVGRNNDIWTREQIGHIKYYLEEGVAVKELRDLYGGSLSAFYDMLRGKTHRFTLPTGPDPEKDLFIGCYK